MKKSMKKVVAGSLVCVMAAAAAPFVQVTPENNKSAYAMTPIEFEVEWYGEQVDGLGHIGLYLGKPHTVNAVMRGDSNATFSYTSSDPSVFTVDENGMLTAVREGSATLTIEADTILGKRIFTKTVYTQPFSYCGDMAYEYLEDGESFRFLQASYASKDVKRVNLPKMISNRNCLIIGERSCSGYNNVIYFEVPEGTKTIEEYAFADNASLKMVMLPESVTEIADNIFGDKALENKIVLKGYEGSAAEEFAKAHKDQVIFEAIEGKYVYYRYIYQFDVENSKGTKGSMELEVGEEAELFIKTDPEVVDEEYRIEVADDSIVSVTSQGAVTAKKSGLTTINIIGETGAKSSQYVTVKEKEVEPTETPTCPTKTPEVTTTPAVTATPYPTPICVTKRPTKTPEVTTTSAVTATPIVTVTPYPTPECVTKRPAKTPEVPTMPAVTATPIMTVTPYPTPVCVTKRPTKTPEVITNSVITAIPEVTSTSAIITTTGTAVTTTPVQGITPLDKKEDASEKGFVKEKKGNKISKKAKVEISTSVKKKFKAGKKYTIKAKKYNTAKKLKWSVSNKKIATINSKTGVLKAKKSGKVTITVTCGTVKDKITIRIKK